MKELHMLKKILKMVKPHKELKIMKLGDISENLLCSKENHLVNVFNFK